ncbi:hypothetical protein TNCV_835491 [Trichonephila clavipes]|nr:hypothetical protein TNCV_835491 [Trichonephila clavipes]
MAFDHKTHLNHDLIEVQSRPWANALTFSRRVYHICTSLKHPYRMVGYFNATFREDDPSCRSSMKQDSLVHHPAAEDIWGIYICDTPRDVLRFLEALGPYTNLRPCNLHCQFNAFLSISPTIGGGRVAGDGRKKETRWVGDRQAVGGRLE